MGMEIDGAWRNGVGWSARSAFNFRCGDAAVFRGFLDVTLLLLRFFVGSKVIKVGDVVEELSYEFPVTLTPTSTSTDEMDSSAHTKSLLGATATNSAASVPVSSTIFKFCVVANTGVLTEYSDVVSVIT